MHVLGEMKLKLLIMSATLSVETFTDFFTELRQARVAGEGPDRDPRSRVHIEGRMFPVKEHFLEDALEWTGFDLPGAPAASGAAAQRALQRLEEVRGGRYSERTARSLAVAGEKEVHQDLLKALVLLFHKAAERCGDRGRGGILVFLPGWRDITDLHAKLQGLIMIIIRRRRRDIVIVIVIVIMTIMTIMTIIITMCIYIYIYIYIYIHTYIYISLYHILSCVI